MGSKFITLESLLVVNFLIFSPYLFLPKAISRRTFDDSPHFMKFLKLTDQASKFPSASVSTTASKLKRTSYYGEPCETNGDCAPGFGLSCKNSSCSCTSPQFIARLNPTKSILNHIRTECVIRAGSKCGVNVNSSQKQKQVMNRAFSAYLWTKIKSNVPFIIDGVREHFSDLDSNCVDNAQCVDGYCKCSPDYFKDSRGLCLRKRTLFQPCEKDKDEQCRSSEGLQCTQEKCQCKRSMVFDKIARKCLIPAGGECDAYSSNAEEYNMECVRNADCSNGHCICFDGYIPSSDGTCGIAHGKPCNGIDKPCSDIQLHCRSGRCQCRYPVHQVYNETLKECLSKPDGPCIPEGDMISAETSLKQNCVANSECVLLGLGEETSRRKSVFDYVCRCIEGYAEDQVGDCVPSYGSPCVEDKDCDQEVGQLSCVDMKCACPDGILTWDESRRKCVGLPGARCRFIQLEKLFSMRMDIPTDCVQNGHCVEHVLRLDGRCECKTGFQFSPSHVKCIPVS